MIGLPVRERKFTSSSSTITSQITRKPSSLRLPIIGHFALGFGLKGYLSPFSLYGDASCTSNFGMGFSKTLLHRLIPTPAFGSFKRKRRNTSCPSAHIDATIDSTASIAAFPVSSREASLFSTSMAFSSLGTDSLSGSATLYFFTPKRMKGLSINETMLCSKSSMLANASFFALVPIAFISSSLCLSAINFFIVVLPPYVDRFAHVFLLLFLQATPHTRQ